MEQRAAGPQLRLHHRLLLADKTGASECPRLSSKQQQSNRESKEQRRGTYDENGGNHPACLLHCGPASLWFCARQNVCVTHRYYTRILCHSHISPPWLLASHKIHNQNHTSGRQEQHARRRSIDAGQV